MLKHLPANLKTTITMLQYLHKTSLLQYKHLMRTATETVVSCTCYVCSQTVIVSHSRAHTHQNGAYHAIKTCWDTSPDWCWGGGFWWGLPNNLGKGETRNTVCPKDTAYFQNKQKLKLIPVILQDSLLESATWISSTSEETMLHHKALQTKTALLVQLVHAVI